MSGWSSRGGICARSDGGPGRLSSQVGQGINLRSPNARFGIRPADQLTPGVRRRGAIVDGARPVRARTILIRLKANRSCMLSQVAPAFRRVDLLTRRRGPYGMAMPALPTTGWTVDMLEALPDDGMRYEIIDGELFVTPAPSYPHQRALREIFRQLDPYLGDAPSAELIFSPADVRSGPRTSVQPDLFVMRKPVRLEGHGWPDLDSLLLAVEVLSSTTARADRSVKRRLYQTAGIPEYWIVDLDARLVERWRPGDERPEVLGETIEWRLEEWRDPLVIDLPALFARILDE
jgi:Uma2 family endonuclease